MNRVIGFDVSSATIGWGVVDYSEKSMSLFAHGHIKPMSKKKSGSNMSKRLNSAYTEVSSVIDLYSPDEIVVEDYILKFSRGRSSANTIVILASFNEIVSLAAYREFGISTTSISVHEIRKAVSTEYFKIKDKDDVLKFVSGIFESEFVITLNRMKNIKKETFDEADGIIAAIAHIFLTRKGTES